MSRTVILLAVVAAACITTTPALAQSSLTELLADPSRVERSLIDPFAAAVVADPDEAIGSTEPAQPESTPAPTPPTAWTFDRVAEMVEVNEHELVRIHIADAPLSTVLQVLSVESERNIVAGSDIDARVTADLYGVTFYEALDAVLHVNGLGYVERGGFIYVYTQEQLDAQRNAARQRITRVIELDYLNATDAGRFVAPLLSEDGTITTPGIAEEFLIPETGPVGKDSYTGLSVLVVNDYADRIDEIEDLVRQLDTRPTQVLVEATILQTTLSEANAFGVDFALIADLDFDSFLSPLDAVDSLIAGRPVGVEEGSPFPGDGEGRAITTAVGDVTAPGTLKAGIIDQDVGVFLRLLDEVTDITVVSNPKLLTLNRQPARVLVGTRVGFLNTTTTETSTTQTVEFLDTGTQLHLRPFVTRDNLIRLELKPQVSTFRPRPTITATGQTVTIPDEDTTELVTNIIVRDGQTIVLGGLFTETTTATRRQVPFLGDVPVIGSAFRGNDDSTSRSEIIFLVTPSIVNDNDLTLEGNRATSFVDQARVGARQGLLPWSRERQVGQLLVEADRLSRQGDLKKARLKVQRALALHPEAADALAMREQLTGDAARTPYRGMLEDILRKEVGGFEPANPSTDPKPNAGDAE